MVNYSTISIPVTIKKLLEKAKGEEDWGEFILKLFIEAKRLKGEKAFKELSETLTEEELEAILKSSKTFREGVTLR
ncbi:MAG: hypothetical protein QXK89_08315 [Candidatus Bathyarchaeia archaeon]